MKAKVFAIAIFAATYNVDAFLPSSFKQQLNTRNDRIAKIKSSANHSLTSLQMSTSADEENSSTATLSKSETILSEFHRSKYTFRIVVVGNGAILETTSKLGPKTATSVSPKTGDKLMTFASEDASFEFHVKVDQVCMVTFVSSERTDGAGATKIMRVSRFLDQKGTPLCSLILADTSEEAILWFEGMVEKYGQEAIM